MADTPADLVDLERRMAGAVKVLRSEFASLRTGRASASLLDKVMVPAYGNATPVPQLGTVTVPEPRALVINVWDKSLAPAVDRAIRQAGLGLNPVMNGQVLRVPVPPLSGERRAELVRVAGRHAESARIAVRNVRRDGMETAKSREKANELNRDQRGDLENRIQKLTDGFIERIDEALKSKEGEITRV